MRSELFMPDYLFRVARKVHSGKELTDEERQVVSAAVTLVAAMLHQEDAQMMGDQKGSKVH